MVDEKVVQDKASRIPDFANREEEAEWRDTHGIVDYFDEMEPTKVRFAKNLSGPIAVRLNESDRVQLAQIAGDQGVGTPTLTRMRVRERLKQKVS